MARLFVAHCPDLFFVRSLAIGCFRSADAQRRRYNHALFARSIGMHASVSVERALVSRESRIAAAAAAAAARRCCLFLPVCEFALC